MNPQALILMVVGLLIGPGYYLVGERISGRQGETYAMTERGNRWALPDGAILRLRGGLGYKPVPLELSPESNDYRLRFRFDVKPGGAAGAKNEYQVSLLHGDSAIERSMQVRGQGNVEVALDPVQVFDPGTYVLVLEEVGTPPLAVSGVNLQIDNRVEKRKPWIAWSGLVLFVFGFGLLMRDALVHWRGHR